MNDFVYKGYHTKIEFSSTDHVLHGKIEGINDLVTFESELSTEIENEFHKAVDEYLEFCKEVGKEPDKEYSGTFNVRVPKELHRALAIKADLSGKTLNACVVEALNQYINEKPVPNINIYLNRSTSKDLTGIGLGNSAIDNKVHQTWS